MDVDNSNHAKYFQQVKNGVYMREAILLKIFGEGFCDPKSNYFVNPEIWKDLDISNGSKKGNNLLYRLDNGTLIDHIENGKGDKVMKVLDLEEYTETPLIYAKNISSKKLGSKDIIGIHNKELSKYELSKLALVADPTINIIKNKHVVKKGKVVLPSVIEELIQCQNPKCISNPDHDEHISSLFHIESIAPLRLRCDYCEKSINKEEIKF
jgi:aspartate carbamoyltransferase regulatory subunit